MKTNTLNVILAANTVSVIGLTVATNIAARNFELLPICVSYTAVAILAALTISDYRGNVKSYAAR